MPLRVKGDDLELEGLPFVDDVARMGHSLMRELADVDQTLEAVADADEGAEVDELGNGAVDDVANLEVGDRGVPRIRLELADRQADATALVVYVDDFGLDLVADLVAGLGVVDLVPRQFALVHETVDPAQVDEDTERSDRAYGSGDLLAHLQAAEEFVALLAPLLVQRNLLREDQAVGLAVDFEDLEAELAAHVRLQLLSDLLRGVAGLVVLRTAREVHDLADRDEATDAAVDDQAALVVVDDRGIDDGPRLELLLHRPPFALEACSAQRQDDVALLRLGLQNVDQDDVPDGQRRSRLGVAAVELAVRDDTFALGSDVDEDLVAIDANHGAFHDITVLEALDVGILLGEELFHGGGLGSPDHRLDRHLGRLLGLLRGRRIDHVVFAHHDRFGRHRGGRLACFAHGCRVENGRGDRLAGLTRRDRVENGRGGRLAGLGRRDRFESGRGGRLAGLGRRDRFESGRGGRLAGLGRRGCGCLGGLVGD